MAAASTLVNGLIQRLKGQRYADSSSTYKPVRLSQYQDMMVQPQLADMQGLCDEGSFYVATNPTFETAVATTTSITTFAETAGAVGVVMMLKNTEQPGENAKRIIPVYIKLMIVQVPTSATSWKYGLVLDNNPVRYTSGGSAISTIYNTNGDASSQTIAQLYFGALTTAVPMNKRAVGRGNLRGVIPTTFDQYMIMFGVGSQAGMSGAAASGCFMNYNAPVVIAPQQNLCLTLWGAANAAAPSYEFEIGWAER